MIVRKEEGLDASSQPFIGSVFQPATVSFPAAAFNDKICSASNAAKTPNRAKRLAVGWRHDFR